MGILQADRRFTGNPRIALLVDLKTLSINLKNSVKNQSFLPYRVRKVK